MIRKYECKYLPSSMYFRLLDTVYIMQEANFLQDGAENLPQAVQL